MDLFEQSRPGYEPLASRMRPRNLDEYVGQDHILGPGRLLRRSIEADRLGSILLAGPPGTGKTTLARVIAAVTRGSFLSLNAVLSGVKEIRETIDQAQNNRRLYGRKTILFVDEVHRWNRSQQDALLPWVENGTFVLVGATTENPFFEVNSALVSRSRVFQLRPLTDEHLKTIATQALRDPDRGYGRYQIDWESGALEHLISIASGDARSLLNAIELAVETSSQPFPPDEGSTIKVSLSAAEESIQKKAVLYDKDGDYHFDTISALIKSVRGSDPDAALYWAARMIKGGEDPDFLFRRLLILASEDVGLADPQALGIVVAAAQTFQRVGLPEGQFALAQAVLYLATAPKSNSTMAYFDALNAQDTQPSGDVPDSLKDASRDGKAWGHGTEYQYPHAYRDHWVAQRYLPASLSHQVFYRPSDQGFEATLRDRVFRRRELQWAAAQEHESENLTWTDDRNARWRARLERSGDVHEAWRARLFAACRLARHHVVWIASDWKSLILGEALRQTPEGEVWASLPDATAQTRIEEFLSFVPDINRPVWSSLGWGVLDPARGTRSWDAILAWAPFLPPGWSPPSDYGRLALVEPFPNTGLKLTDWIAPESLKSHEIQRLRELEDDYIKERFPRRDWRELGLVEEAVEFKTEQDVPAEDWVLWWSPGRPGGWVEWLLEREPDWSDRLETIRMSPLGRATWTRRWSIWNTPLESSS